jgi:membrane-associated phospholipid phosphatase
MNRALLVSKVFHPLLVAPFLALFYLRGTGVGLIESFFWISVWIVVAMVPTALATYFTGERKLNIESGPERRAAYITGISAAAVSLFLTWYFSAPQTILRLGAAGIVSAAAFGTANHIDKVSVHTGTLAGFSGLYLALSPFWSAAIGAAALIVSWSRVRLEVHSREQVLQGTLLGVLCGLTVLLL